MQNTKSNKNMHLFSLYKMISWDLLFYYSVIFLFLVQVKNISPSLVFLGETFYTIFKFILQIPSTGFVVMFGKRNCLIFANSFVCISTLIFIFCTNFVGVILAQLFSAIGFTFKSNCEDNILYDSIPESDNRRHIFASINGRATSYFYYLEAISCTASGFLYVINPYIPLIFCLIFSVFSTIISIRFEDIDKHVSKKGGFRKRN